MKVKKIPTAVISSTFLLNSYSALSAEHLVQRGDSFTKIIQSYSRESDHLSYSQMLALTLKLNEKSTLFDYDKIDVGQRIRLPDSKEQLAYLKYYKMKYPSYWDPSLWKIKADKKYSVRPGDSVSKIAKRLMPDLPLFGDTGSVKLILEKNKTIKSKDKIFVGQELVLPTKSEIAIYIKNNKKLRLPASELKKTKKDKEKQSSLKKENNLNALLNEVIRDQEKCTNVQSRCYKIFEKNLLESTKRIVTLDSLKNLLELSREFHHESLEEFYLSMITLFLKADKEDLFLQSLRSYFSMRYNSVIV